MAAQTVEATLTVKLSIAETSLNGLTSAKATGYLNTVFDWTNGVAANTNAINQIFCKAVTAVTLNGGTNTTYNLLSLTDDEGVSRSFANGVRGVLIQVTSRTAGNYLLVGNASANSWTGFCSVNTATLRVVDNLTTASTLTDVLPVNATSNQVRIANPGNSAITFKLAVWGNT